MALGEDCALIEVQGVGYVAFCGGRTLARFSVGEPAFLHIETQVREDSIKLFGFASEEERGWFVHLQSVQGVGARVALAILDTLNPGELGDALALQDKASLARANGVGPKLAARIVQELSGKAAPRGFLGLAAHQEQQATAAPVAGGERNMRADAVSALVNLGIDPINGARAVATAMKALPPDAPTAEVIRAALKEMQRA
jgi:Holliday junction DNA helicase RuvA